MISGDWSSDVCSSDVAAEAQVRNAAVRGGNGRVRGNEIGGIVVQAEHRGQPVDELRRPATPRHAVSGVGGRTADARGDGTGGQQAGPPDRAVTGRVETGVPEPAPKRRQRVPEADRPGERDRARAFHRPILRLTVNDVPSQYCDVMTPFDDPQGELAWMFLQSTTEGGDLDEGDRKSTRLNSSHH